MSWESLWAFWTLQSKEIKQDILEQLDLGNFLPTLSYTQRMEVLQFAPQEIVQEYSPQKAQSAKKLTTKTIRGF